MLIAVIAAQTTSNPLIPAGGLPTATAMALSGTPRQMEPSANPTTLSCFGSAAGRGGAAWVGADSGGPGTGSGGQATTSASLTSTRASVCLPIRSTNDSATAYPYAGPSSSYVSAAARNSAAGNGESVMPQI